MPFSLTQLKTKSFLGSLNKTRDDPVPELYVKKLNDSTKQKEDNSFSFHGLIPERAKTILRPTTKPASSIHAKKTESPERSLPSRPLRPAKHMNKEIAACTDLLRQFYTLETRIFSMRDKVDAEQTREMLRLEQDLLRDEIKRRVERWQTMDVDWCDEEWAYIESIAVDMEGLLPSNTAKPLVQGVRSDTMRRTSTVTSRSIRGSVRDTDGATLNGSDVASMRGAETKSLMRETEIRSVARYA
jgi:hypothetical protein